LYQIAKFLAPITLYS